MESPDDQKNLELKYENNLQRQNLMKQELDELLSQVDTLRKEELYLELETSSLRKSQERKMKNILATEKIFKTKFEALTDSIMALNKSIADAVSEHKSLFIDNRKVVIDTLQTVRHLSEICNDQFTQNKMEVLDLQIAKMNTAITAVSKSLKKQKNDYRDLESVQEKLEAFIKELKVINITMMSMMIPGRK